MVENQRKQEILKSLAELEKTRAEQELIISQAKIKAENEALITKMKMEKDVETKRIEMQVEKQRATDLTQTQVKAEMDAKKAEGEANSKKILADALYYTTQREADAKLYSIQKQAEAEANSKKILADVLYYTTQQEADAKLYSKQKEADAINRIYDAQAEGLKKLVESFGGNPQAFISYTLMDKGIYEKIAETNAKAIQGLNPKITVWTHDASKGMEPIQNLAKSVIPMLETIESQTGYKLPEWILQGPKILETNTENTEQKNTEQKNTEQKNIKQKNIEQKNTEIRNDRKKLYIK